MRRLIAALAALLALSALQPAAAQTAPGEASAYPEAGPAGTRFSFVASGFQPRERVAVWLNTPDGRALAVETENLRRATSAGRANWSWVAPEGAQPGAYQMVAHGVSSGVERVMGFRVGQAEPAAPPAAAPARANVYPGEGRAGSLFLFYAQGYAEGEGLALWVNRPDGRAEAVEQLERLDRDGDRLDFSWLAPNDAPPGRWEMVVVGRESGAQTVIPFVITGS